MERIEFKATVSAGLEGRIEGFASVFGTLDRGGDVMHKGAFASARAPIPMLDSHHPDAPIGVWEEVTETAAGLQVKGRLLVQEVARAAEVLALIEAGGMRGLSIGYIATKANRRANGVRDLLSVELVEISVVAVPMCPGAEISAVKSAEGETMTKEELAKMLAELGITKPEEKAFDPAKAMADALAPITTQLAELEAKLARPGGLGAPAIIGGKPEPTPEQKAFQIYMLRGPLAGETELKLLTAASDPNGGYMVTPEMSSEIIKDIVPMSPLRKMASLRGTNAPSVIYPTRKPAGNATWDDDTTPEPETTATAIFGQLEIFTKPISTFVDIPNSLLQDAPAVEAEIKAAIVEDFAKKESTAFVNGAGIYDPEGIMSNPDVPQFLAGGAAITNLDPLVDLYYSIQQDYRDKGVWLMNGNTIGKIRKLKDSTGQQLWQSNVQLGQPDLLLGRPVIESVDMPDVAANAFPILYGDFSGYRILDRLTLSMLVDPYSQATLKRTRYHFGRRVGGRLLQAIKFKKLKMA